MIYIYDAYNINISVLQYGIEIHNTIEFPILVSIDSMYISRDMCW